MLKSLCIPDSDVEFDDDDYDDDEEEDEPSLLPTSSSESSGTRNSDASVRFYSYSLFNKFWRRFL